MRTILFVLLFLFTTVTNAAVSVDADQIQNPRHTKTWTFPAVSGVFSCVACTETLIGKTLTSPVINSPTGISKSDVGLSSVDNTSDVSKPVSTAQAAADAGVQAYSIQRANHTGSQAISTVTSLQDALDAKQSSLSFSLPLVNTAGTISIPVATNSADGYLSLTDWLIFNAKQPAGNYLTALTGDVTVSGPGSGVSVIAASAVTNAKLANMAQSTIKGRAASAGTGVPVDLTATQATAILDSFVGDAGSGGTKGLVPAPSSGDAAANKFLKANGVWTAFTSTGDVAGPSSATDSAVALFDGTTGKLLKDSVVTIANIRDRTTHTGTQAASTISDFNTAVAATALLKANNLSDVQSVTTSATNLGLGTGNSPTFAGINLTGAETITSSSANALAVGLNGATNPALQINANAASSVTGVKVTSAAAAGGVFIDAISSGGSEPLTISSKSTGNATLASPSTGQVILSTNGAARAAADDASFNLTPTTSNTAATVRLKFTGAADAALTAGAESPSVYLNSGQIRTHASNTAITLQRDQRITPSTHAFASSGGVVTNAAALAIDGPPIGGTNSTLTNSSALYIPTSALTNTTNGYGANIAATTGATNNYAAVFNGGNVGIGTSAPSNILSVSASTGITAGTHIAATINTNLSPNSGSSADFRGTVLSTMTTTAQTYSGAMSGSWHETRMNSAGSVASSSGIRSFGMVFGSAAVNFTALTQAQAILTQGISSFSNTATGTITAASGMRAINSVLNNQTLTGQAGIIVEPLTAATNNSAMVIGSTSIPTGNFGIYNASTNNNYFNGNVGIKITAPAASIHTDAGTATASNHKFTAGTTTGQTSSDGVDFGIDASGNGIINQREALDTIFLTNNAEVMRLKSAGNIVVPTTVTAGGTTGNQTINKISGTVNIAAVGTTVTVTNSLVSANSIVMAVARTNDGTCRVANVVPASGSFVINVTAACTAETSIGFFVVN